MVAQDIAGAAPLRVHCLECGRVRIKQAQAVGVGHGLARRARPLVTREWTDWLPIHAYAIERADGIVVVDTGGNAGLMKLPQWHPYFRLAVQFDIDREQEIGPRLKALGIGRRDVRTVVLTHLHIDHDGGLGDFAGTRVLVAPGELRAASRFAGQLGGYLPQRWPRGFDPEPLRFAPKPLGLFAETQALTDDGAILVAPTPGHTHNHVSVIAAIEGGYVVFTGDATYSLASFRAGLIDGISPDEGEARDSLRRIAALDGALLLPAHDPTSPARLAEWSRRQADRERSGVGSTGFTSTSTSSSCPPEDRISPPTGVTSA